MTQSFGRQIRSVCYIYSGWTITLLATRGPPLVTWRWALRDEGDDRDGRTGQYSGDQDHHTSFLNYERRPMPIDSCAFLASPYSQ